MTTGAGETVNGILDVYEDPTVLLEAIQAIPEVITNFDEVIASMPEAIDEQQRQNNPHDPDDEYYEDFRMGWYQGYFFWFVVEMAIPTGQASTALKSSERVQSAVDALSNPQIRKAARLLESGRQTATAPVRYSQAGLSRGLSGSIGLTGGHRVRPAES